MNDRENTVASAHTKASQSELQIMFCLATQRQHGDEFISYPPRRGSPGRRRWLVIVNQVAHKQARARRGPEIVLR